MGSGEDRADPPHHASLQHTGAGQHTQGQGTRSLLTLKTSVGWRNVVTSYPACDCKTQMEFIFLKEARNASGY